MKKIILFAAHLVLVAICTAQHISAADKKTLQQKEDSLKSHALDLIQNINAQNRFAADSTFTKMFVRALKINHAFDYPFDSLITISKLYPPDSSFRIFTWQLVVNDDVIRQHGAIQMKTADGSLKLFPLIDKSDIMLHPSDTVSNNMGWMGAVYYRMVQTQTVGQRYYTLLGYDENNLRSNRKIIEVLHFADGAPVFGGAFFNFSKDIEKHPAISRYIMEYKKSTGARLNYDEQLGMIIYEHLISETNEPAKKFTLIPDGDYEGFKWTNGQWLHVDKVFNQVTPEGFAPSPNPVKDEQGNTIEGKLKDNVQ